MISERRLNYGVVMSLPLLFALFACGSDSKDTGSSLVADVANGQTIHDTRCMACHSSNPSMSDNVSNLSDDELEDVILNGIGSMPGQFLTEQELVDLIAYLRETYP